MHVYFSGIGGSGLSSLALMAKQTGFTVSGSDKQDNHYVHYLKEQGVSDIHEGQTWEQIEAVHAKNPIDWLVYTSALSMENPDAPELRFCQEKGIRATKRDEFLSFFLNEQKLKMIAIAGTHGKTTTTAMAVWLFKQLDIPISYNLAGSISFGDSAQFSKDSTYFVYEADEFDRNFLAFHPYLSLISGIDWDHPDIYPSRENYYAAFRTFLDQSEAAVLWDSDAARLQLAPADHQTVLDDDDRDINEQLHLSGLVNRLDAWLVAHAVHQLTGKPLAELLVHLNKFPGVGRRFEQLAPGLVTDYAHTAPKIRGALQAAYETAGDNVVVVYEGLHNTRQHFMKDELKHLFDSVEKLYVVPSYLAREDPNLPLLSPKDLIGLLGPDSQAHALPAQLNDELEATIRRELGKKNLVLCISAGSGGSLDEWLRQRF